MSSSTSSTRACSSAPARPYILPQNTRFSRALMSGYRAMSWGTTPMASLTAWGSVTTECPSTNASPPLGCSRHESMEIVVLLPAPLGPRRLKISPRAMSKLTPSTASTPLGGSYCLRSSWTSTMLTNSPSPCGTAADAFLYTARRPAVTYNETAGRLAVYKKASAAVPHGEGEFVSIGEVQELRKQYDPPKGVLAVDGVSFDIARGEIFSLLGPNGAGKSTTISMLSCLLHPSGGDAFVDGHSVVTDPQAVKEAIGVVPQDIALYPDMSARENLLFWGKMYGLAGAELHT